MKTSYKTLFAGLMVSGFMAFSSAASAATSPETVAGATTVDTEQAKALWQDGAAMLDTRKDSDWDAAHIPEAIHLDRKNPAKYNEAAVAAEIAKDEPVISYCNGHSCLRSAKTAADLVKWGYTKVYYYRDGLPAWMSAGNSIE